MADSRLADERDDADPRANLLAALERPPDERNRAVRVAMSAWLAADGAAAITAARADAVLRDVAGRMMHLALYAYPEVLLDEPALLEAVPNSEHLVGSAAVAIAQYDGDVARALIDKFLSADYAATMRPAVDHYEKLTQGQTMEESYAELESVLGEGDRRKQLSRIHWLINRVAQDDPGRAARLIDAAPRRSSAFAIDLLIDAWSRTDPQGAADWLAGKDARVSEGGWRTLGLGWGHADFDVANAYAQTLTGRIRAAFLAGLSGVAARLPLREAQAWLSRYERDAAYADLVIALAPQLAPRDPQVAVSMVADLPEDLRFDAYIRFTPTIRDDPARLVAAITELGNDSVTDAFLPVVASRWADDDPQSALDWASTLERGAVRDKVLGQIALSAMDFDIGLAVEALEGIDNAEVRGNPVCELLVVIESDAEAVRRGKGFGVDRETVVQLRAARRPGMASGRSSGGGTIYLGRDPRDG